MLEPHLIALPVYAESDAEAEKLEEELKEFVKRKYQQGVYVRAASLTRLIQQYGNSSFINPYIR